MATNYTVRPTPGLSDDSECTYFAIKGPYVDHFAMMERIARFLEAALNAANQFADSN